MSAADSSAIQADLSYPRTYRILHWTYAGLVAAQFVLMLTFRQMQTLEFGRALLDLHISFGLLTLVAAAIRIASSPFRRRPRLPGDTARWQVWSARLVHAGLLGLVVAMPLLGWAVVSARGYETRFLGVFALPAIAPTDPALADQALAWHAIVATALLALLGVHLAAVAFHSLVRKRSVLARMLPKTKSRTFRNRIPLWQQVILAAGVVPVLGASIGLSGLADNTAAIARSQVSYDQSVEALGHGYAARIDVKTLMHSAGSDGAKTGAHAPPSTEVLQDAADELGGIAQTALTRDQKAAAQTLALAAASWPQTPPTQAELGRADAALGDILAALNDQAFTAKAAILHKSQRSHDLLVLSLGPALALGLIAALFVALNVRGLLGRVRTLAGAIARREPPEDHQVVGQGEIAQLMRELLTTQDLLVENDKALNENLSQLTAAREKADSANEAKSQFLANVSHEIRTPLNGVLGMVQVMEMGDLAEEQRGRLSIIRQSGQLLLQVLNDVLDFSKIEARKLELNPADFDLEEVIRGAISVFADSAAGKGLQLDYKVQDSTLGVWLGDAPRIRQILMNLLSNAIKFTDAGSVSLAVADNGSELTFVVADSGIGIAAPNVAKLFSKFSQVDDSNTRRFSGTGLGLAICRELAELMGGDIRVESVLGSGTEFHVSLPLLRRAGPAPAQLASPPAADSRIGTDGDRPLRILAAEDNPTNQVVLSALMGTLNVDLTTVANGREAVEAWRTTPFDLILMDIQMPQMGGVEATRRIRAEEARRDQSPIPIIALSANVIGHQVAEYLDAGMTAHVAKPIDFAALCAAIDDVLSDAPEPAASAVARAPQHGG